MPQKVIVPIVSQHQVSPGYYRLQFASQSIARSAQAGQFVHILTRSDHIRDPLLRRAFSILSVTDETFDVLYKMIGKGTGEMKLWSEGQVVDVIGPLGKPFELPNTTTAADSEVLLVGGGVGVPPLAMLASQRQLGLMPVHALIGARSRGDVMCREIFKKQGVAVEVATEDGSEGYKGLVTGLLQNHLNDLAQRHVGVHVYSCGPLPMLRAVAAVCLKANVPCQVSLEESMPCGIGICNGCVVPVIGAGDDYGKYRRICVDGPVMRAQDVDWSHWEPKPCQ